jgi:serine O-acetyltransferase
MSDAVGIDHSTTRPSSGDVSAICWKEMRRRLARDRERLAAAGDIAEARFFPCYLAVLIYRLSNYAYRRGRRRLARLLWQLNFLVTGVDIAPLTEAGAGLVILHPISTKLFGSLGRDCTVWGYGGLGGGRSASDIGGGGPGLPVLGDRVVLGPRALVLGPVRIGDDCVVGPGCIVLDDLKAGSQVSVAESAQIITAVGLGGGAGDV